MATKRPNTPPDPFVPIQASAGLYLLARGHGDDARFARLCQATWLRIPFRYRRLMVAHWRRADAGIRLRFGVARPLRKGEVNPLPTLGDRTRQFADAEPPLICPRVEMIYGWDRTGYKEIPSPTDEQPPYPVAPPTEHDGGTLAAACAFGNLLRFRAGAVDRMPDNVVQDLVAHELGHVFCRGTGWRAEGEKFFGVTPSVDFEEAWVDDMVVRHWGFEVDAIDEWCADVGIGRRITFASPKAYAEYLQAQNPTDPSYRAKL